MSRERTIWWVRTVTMLVPAISCVLSATVGAQRLPPDAQRALIVASTWADGSTLRAGAADTAWARRLRSVIDSARRDVEAFFGAPFAGPVAVTLVPDRATFSAILKNEWGVPETACWMVATGVADFLVVLSPRVWSTDACEHDASDGTHVRDIMMHELVHAYHGQHHPSRDFDFAAADEMGWFIEGLATYASGQLERGRMATARQALDAGAAPARLADAWSGRYRYGVAGSMVQYVDHRVGRRALVGLLGTTSNAALLAALNLTESDFLAAWTAWVKGEGR